MNPTRLPAAAFARQEPARQEPAPQQTATPIRPEQRLAGISTGIRTQLARIITRVQNMRAHLAQLILCKTAHESTTQLSQECQTLLDNWINQAINPEEKPDREKAKAKIIECLLQQQKILNLDDLGLTSLPEIWHHCSHITDIRLNSNQLENLNLSSLSNLKSLSCSYNPQLSTLDLSNLSQLQILECYYNPLLSRLDLSNLSQLQTLRCSGNRLLSLNPNQLNFLANLPSLQDCYFSNTQITWNQLPERLRNNQNIYIDIRPERLRDQNLNAAQNTHTASIHAGASANASFLQENLAKENLAVENTDQAWNAMTAWANKLSTTRSINVDDANKNNFDDANKNAAVQRFMQKPSHLEHK